MHEKMNFVREELAALSRADMLRKLRIAAPLPTAPSLPRRRTPASGAKIILDGKETINFASNDYLGLARDKRVIAAAVSAAEICGAGASSSRSLSGNLDLHSKLETALAGFKNTGAALVFPSGYQTNVSTIQALVSDTDCVILDRLNHASLIDGARLSGAKMLVYRHADMDDLARALRLASRFRRKLIISDALFSMDGDLAPLEEIAALASKHSAILMVDEAHSTGVFGARGAGAAEHFGVEDKIDIKMGTLSKAFGSQGGFLCVSGEMKEYLLNKARGFIYTTALAPPAAAAALAAVGLTEKDKAPDRAALLAVAADFRRKVKSLGYDTLGSVSQIVPVLVGSAGSALKLSGRLLEEGIYAPAVRFPTVPKDSARLRISLTSSHTREEINALLDALKTCS